MRLIDADELKRQILIERDKIPLTLPGAVYEFRIAKPNHFGNAMRGGIRKALRCMENCKTIDAVSVVRCKDCKHFTPDEICYPGTGSCWFCEMTRKFDDFCSYGERKDNGTND